MEIWQTIDAAFIIGSQRYHGTIEFELGGGGEQRIFDVTRENKPKDGDRDDLALDLWANSVSFEKTASVAW